MPIAQRVVSANPPRQATLADLPELVRLESASFAGDRVSRRSFRRWLGKDNNALLVQDRVDSSGALAAYALVLFHPQGRIARLYSLAVDQDLRGLGLAARLLSAGQAAARKHGYSELRLEVSEQNGPALDLYRKLGFDAFDKRLSYYDDGSHALRLRLAIG